ncbi:MAG: hypothetical protein ING44_03380 [Telmatospirillum sp.]|nr:hypothetical protein [Telmatospirillum sp.]
MSDSTNGQSPAENSVVCQTPAEPAPGGQQVEFSTSKCIDLLQAKEWDALSKYLLDGLIGLSQFDFDLSNEHHRHYADIFVQTLMFCFCHSEYQIPEKYAEVFIRQNETLSNIAYFSSFGTTDPALKIVLRYPDNIVKVLTLYSARSKVSINRDAIMSTNLHLASIWYFAFVGDDFGKLASPVALENLREHFRHLDTQVKLATPELNHAYFMVTYAAPDAEAHVKRTINRIIQRESPPDLPQSPKLRRDRIVVITSFWYPAHAVYRTISKFAKALKGKYKMTLVVLDGVKDVDMDLFDERIDVAIVNGNIDTSAVYNVGAMVAFYPDVGMSASSVILANQRLAPIQIMACGHPVSTFGSKIDYFLSGRDIETEERARRNYSERLVLIPGRGATPNKIEWPRKYPVKSQEPVIVFCPWSAPKTNADILRVLKKISDRSKKHVVFHFSPGGGLRRNGYTPYVMAIHEILGPEHVVIHPPMATQDYLERFEQAHLCLDAFPFGGLNTIVDPLYLGIPPIAYEGTRSFNQYAAHLLRKLGFAELIAGSDEDYIAKALRLIEDTEYREEITRRVAKIDFARDVFGEGEHVAPYFAKAVEYLIEHHDDLSRDGSNGPIYVD